MFEEFFDLDKLKKKFNLKFFELELPLLEFEESMLEPL